MKTFEAKPKKSLVTTTSVGNFWEKTGVSLGKTKTQRGKPISFKNNFCKKSENVFFVSPFSWKSSKTIHVKPLGVQKLLVSVPSKKIQSPGGSQDFSREKHQSQPITTFHYHMPASWISWITIGQS